MLFDLFSKRKKRNQAVARTRSAIKQDATSPAAEQDDALEIRTVELSASELKVGMFVRELDIPWEESPFLFQGFRLDSEDDIKEVQKVCHRVTVDMMGVQKPATELKAVASDESPEARQKAIYAEATIPVEDEINVASRLHEMARESVSDMFDDLHTGKEIDVERVQNVVDDCVESIIRNPDAMLWMMQIKNTDDYTAQHSINVATLAITLGRHLGMPPEQLELLGTSALLFDVGKTKLPEGLVSKPSEYAPEEFKAMQTHTILGRDILRQTNGVEQSYLDVSFSHHERYDGGGYPQGLKANEIPYFARLVAIADTYDAITSDRPHQKAQSISEALRLIYSERFAQFDPDLVVKFIESIGVFPPGSIVEMKNGEVGIVLSNTPDDKLNPRVILVLDEEKNPQPPRVVDLSSTDSDALGERYVIRSTLRNGAYGIDVAEFQRGGLHIEQFTT